MSDYWGTVLPGQFSARESFWDAADSLPVGHAHAEPCQPGCTIHDGWRTERRDGRCLALTGTANRCSEIAPETFPFCERYHAKRAMAAFGQHVIAQLRFHQTPHLEVAFFVRRLLEAMGAKSRQIDEAADLISPQPEFEAAPPALVTRAPERTALYRHYDADAVLLYVGIANDPALRFKAHAHQSVWTQFAARHEGEWFASREEAEAAERVAIREESPLFNKAHAAPDRDERVKRYLVTHEAWELLTPTA